MKKHAITKKFLIGNPATFWLLLAAFTFSLAAANQADGRDILQNGGFEDRTLLPWQAEVWEGFAHIIAQRDTRDPIAGRASARISVEGSDDAMLNEWWHLVFRQILVVQEDHNYTVSFTIRSDRPATCLVQLVEDVEPYRFIGNRQINTSEEPARFEFRGTSAFTGTAQVLFLFGRTERGTQFWIDDVQVIEQAP